MTPQEIFDKVCVHLFTQRTPAMNDGGDCLYRGPDGTRCAVGALIPDDVYEERIEFKDVYGIREWLIEKKLFRFSDVGLLKELQDVHDCWPLGSALAPPESLATQLRDVAEDHDLDDSILTDELVGVEW